MRKTATPQKQRLSSEHWCELQNLSDIITLTAFAADARRTLQAIDQLKDQYPETGELINSRVGAANNWIDHEDALANVLVSVNHRLEALLDGGGE